MEKLKVVNPYSLEVIEEIEYDSWEIVEGALERAYDTFRNSKGHIPKYKRIAIIESLYELIRQERTQIIKIAVEEGGKPYKDTIVEINRALNGIKLAINAIENLHGKIIPMGHTESSANRMAYTKLEPLGVVLAISAFNHPINLIIHQVVTAIAIGAPVIIKPALKTPLTCKFLVEIIYKAGLPVDWCQLIICKNKLTERMAADKKIAYVSFIGSYRVGWQLRSRISAGTKIALEHGGVASVIIEKDADLEALIPGLVKGAYYHAGQVCVSVQRIYVHNNIMEDFLNQFLATVKKLKTGDPIKKKTDIGPLILPEELERVDRWVKDAVLEGGRILYGGKAISNVCYEPTILLEPAAYSYVTTEEIFGPVVSVYNFKNRKNVIKKVNALPFSFQSAIYTSNIDNAMFYANKLKANTVMVNDHSAFRVDWMPFGGSELSGQGTGGIEFSMRDMCKEKLIVLKSPDL